MKLGIAIPALNEEDNIESIIERSLDARQYIREHSAVTEVEVTVVSDGSTDRTEEIAKGYAGVDVLAFPTNRGYGAAIKAGWQHAPSDLLAFLDADGTCDPRFFGPMCRTLIDDGCDLVLGGRMGAGSRMPFVRRVGNVSFAILLGHLSRKPVGDTASGMRVVRRSALAQLLPLPDGLHFTPAMSAVALMGGDLKIAEIEMPYAERVGRSKLRAVRDGLRFLAVILSAAAYVRVSRLTLPLMLLVGTVGVGLMVDPTLFYLRHRSLEEWMFYRFVLVGVLETVVVIALCATIVTEHVVALTLLRYERFGIRARGLWRYETLRVLTGVAGVLLLFGAWLNWSGVVQLLTTGHVTLHWSRVVLGAFIGINFTLVVATLCTLKVIRALHQRQPFLTGRGEWSPPA
jgi:glycosyltransferase involved in cell wall biosynthesis